MTAGHLPAPHAHRPTRATAAVLGALLVALAAVAVLHLRHHAVLPYRGPAAARFLEQRGQGNDRVVRALVSGWKEHGQRRVAALAADIVAEAVRRPVAEALVPVPADPEDRSDGRVRPRAPGEFVCQSCFLVKHPSQLADEKRQLCADCV